MIVGYPSRSPFQSPSHFAVPLAKLRLPPVAAGVATTTIVVVLATAVVAVVLPRAAAAASAIAVSVLPG